MMPTIVPISRMVHLGIVAEIVVILRRDYPMAAPDKLKIVCIDCGTTNLVPAPRLADRPTCGRCKAPLFQGEPAELTSSNFDTVLRNTDLPVLIDFWAPWCGPCRMMAPAYAQAAERLEPHVRVAKLDTEQAPEIAGRFGIRSIPTLALFHQGKEVARQSGAMDLTTLLRWVDVHRSAAA